jgi:hypothetical protein
MKWLVRDQQAPFCRQDDEPRDLRAFGLRFGARRVFSIENISSG